MKAKVREKIKFKLVYIEWADSTSISEWKFIDEAIKWAENSVWIVKHVGWIIKETDKYILIGSNIADDGKQVGNLQKIPKTWIRKRKRLYV